MHDPYDPEWLTQGTHGSKGIAESNVGQEKEIDRGRLFRRIRDLPGLHAGLEWSCQYNSTEPEKKTKAGRVP